MIDSDDEYMDLDGLNLKSNQAHSSAENAHGTSTEQQRAAKPHVTNEEAKPTGDENQTYESRESLDHENLFADTDIEGAIEEGVGHDNATEEENDEADGQDYQVMANKRPPDDPVKRRWFYIKQWLATHGGWVNPSLKLEQTPNSGVGLFAKKRIRKDQVSSE